MLGQLNNSLHYDIVDSDPTLDHFEQVKTWGRKWLSEGQISQEIATWITNLEPKPGVAFGNVKTHKRDNPLSLHLTVVQLLNDSLPLLNFISSHFPRTFHHLLSILPI